MVSADKIPRHGTRSRWKKGCKCPPCVKANSDYRKRYRAQKEAQLEWWQVELEEVAKANKMFETRSM